MEDWIRTALACWERSDTKLDPPASESEIEQTEKLLSFKFPDDLKQLYSVANGFVDYDRQEHMFSFWSLGRIVEECRESSDKKFIGFCDFLIMSHCIGYVKGRPGIFRSYDHAEGDQIVGNYSEVVQMINSTHNDIY